MEYIIKREKFAPGAVLFKAGESGDSAYLIESGGIRITVQRDGQAVVIAELGAGELIGEMALIDNKPRSATATTTTNTTVVPIRREDLNHKLESADPLLKMLLLVVLERFRASHDRFVGDNPVSVSSSHDAEFETTQSDAVFNIRLIQDIREALSSNAFKMYYQPIIDYANREIAGCEALIRWHHHSRGDVPPLQFLGVAAETGLIETVGLWTIQQVCKDIATVQAACGPPGNGFVSINISARQLERLDQAERILRIISESGIDASAIKLEITETLLIREPEIAEKLLEVLKAAGIQIALDDFGTGYASLSYLQRYPIDVLKIDRSFISKMLGQNESLQIVRATLSLAFELGMEVVAEGVETINELDRLVDYGCNLMQGNYYSKPLAIDELQAFARNDLPANIQA